jgi:hypothetical protein
VFPRPWVDELTAFLRRQLAPHKAPVFWAFRDELPMTPSGKIQKFVLREEVDKGLLAFDEVHDEPRRSGAHGRRVTAPPGGAVYFEPAEEQLQGRAAIRRSRAPSSYGERFSPPNSHPMRRIWAGPVASSAAEALVDLGAPGRIRTCDNPL